MPIAASRTSRPASDDGEADAEPGRVVVAAEALLRVRSTAPPTRITTQAGTRRRAAPRKAPRASTGASGRAHAGDGEDQRRRRRRRPASSRRRRAGRAAGPRTVGLDGARSLARLPDHQDEDRRRSPGPAAHDIAFAVRVAQQRAQLGARRVALAGEPLGELPRALLLARRRACRARSRPPRGRARPRPRTRRSCSRRGARARGRRRASGATPSTTTGSATRTSRRSWAISLGRSARSARTLQDARDRPSRRRSRNAPVTCSISSQW